MVENITKFLANLRERLFRDLEKPEHIKAANEIMETIEQFLFEKEAANDESHSTVEERPSRGRSGLHDERGEHS